MKTFMGVLVSLIASLLVELSFGNVIDLCMVVPLSGSISRIGGYYKQGYMMALEEVKRSGGLYWNGQKSEINVTILDSQSTASVGGEVLTNFLESKKNRDQSKNPVFILGGYSSSRIPSEVKAANDYRTVYVNGGGATAKIYTSSDGGSNTNKYAFGLLASIEKLASTLLNYMETQMDKNEISKPQRIALLWETSSHGESFRKTIVQRCLTNPEYFTLAYASDFAYKKSKEANFTYLGLDMQQQSNIELSLEEKVPITALLVDAHSTEFVNMQKELWYYDFTNLEVVSYGARGTVSTDILKLNPHELAANDLITAVWWNPSSTSEASRKFVRDWRIFEGFSWAEELERQAIEEKELTSLYATPSEQLPVEWYGALGYEAAKVLFQAINGTQTGTEEGVKTTLQNIVVTNSILPGGTYTFDENGQANYNYSLVQNAVSKTVSSEDTVVESSFHTLYPPEEKSGDFRKFRWNVTLEACTLDFVGTIQKGCDSQSKRSIEFYWLDRKGNKCEDQNEPCGCEPTTEFALPKPVQFDCEYLSINSAQGVAVIAFCTFGAIVCVLSLCVLLYHYNHVVMKAGQREFLAVMCFAGLWCNIAGISFLGPNRTSMCITRVFSLLMSLTLLVASLTVKVYRIYKIWNNSTMKRIVITACDMFKLLFILMLGIIIIFIIWMIVEQPEAIFEKRSPDVLAHGVTQNVLVDYQECKYFESAAFPSIAIGYIIIILFYCNLLSFQGRNSDAKYMESRSIMFASYCITFILAIVVIVVAATSISVGSTIVLIALSLVFSSVCFVGLVLGPKIYFATKPEWKQLKRGIQNKLGSGTGNRSSHTSDATSNEKPLTEDTDYIPPTSLVHDPSSSDKNSALLHEQSDYVQVS